MALPSTSAKIEFVTRRRADCCRLLITKETLMFHEDNGCKRDSDAKRHEEGDQLLRRRRGAGAEGELRRPLRASPGVMIGLHPSTKDDSHPAKSEGISIGFGVD